MNFTIKTYTFEDNYKSTINPNTVKNEISFSSQINGGFGQLSLLLNEKINSTLYIEGDIIRVWGEGKVLIYTGYIDFINQSATNFEQIEVKASGVFSYLTRSIYNANGDFFKTLTGDPKEIIDESIDKYNLETGSYFPLVKLTESFGIDVKYNVSYATTQTIIKDVSAMASLFYYYVDQYNNFIFKEKGGTANHVITFKKDIFELKVENDASQLFNRVNIKWKTGDGIGASPPEYNDLASQAKYGLREKFIDNQAIESQTSLDEFAAKFLQENAVPKRRITLTITPDYKFDKGLTFDDLEDQTFDDLLDKTFDDLVIKQDVHSLNPGDILKIRNLSIDYGNLLITKKTYNPYRVTLFLDDYDNFVELIKT